MSNNLQTIIEDIYSGDFDWYQAFEAFRAWLPPYEIRIIIMVLILAMILLINRKPKLKNIDNKKYKNDINSKSSELTNPKNINKQKGTIKKGNSISTLTTSLSKFLQFDHKLKGYITLALTLILIVFIYMTFLIRPSVISSTPKAGDYMTTSNGQITLIFDLPVNKDWVGFNISPEIEGDWKFESVSKILPTKRKVVFTPERSFYPDTEVVVYVVGIRSDLSEGKLHEQSIEMHSPKIPNIVSIKPANGEINVPIDQVIEIEYDAPVGDFVRLDHIVEPTVPFTQFEIDEHTVGIRFTEELSQDETYMLGIMRTPRAYFIKSGKDDLVGDTELISTTTFNTVTTPLVESYTPKGNSVSVDSEVIIVFDQAMNKQSVEEHFNITPEIAGEFVWEDDRTLHYLLSENLQKEKEYSITLAPGFISSESGSANNEIKLDFKTIGYVEVSSVAPKPGSYGLDPTRTNIELEFNQPVDKESAQSNFEIVPNVNGQFKWEGNKLIFETAGRLNYSTKYNVKVKPGVKTIAGLDSIQEFNYTFVTKDNIFTLNVPWYKQQEGFTCNIAATRMALAYRGIYVSEYDVKTGVGIGEDPNQNWVPGYGVHWGPISNYISQYRNVAVKSGWNVAELAQEVEKGNPVIIWWYNRYSQPYGSYTLPSGVTAYMGMHSEVVRGFVGSSSDPTALLTNDPWRGNLTYPTSLFISTWSYLGYKAVVVY